MIGVQNSPGTVLLTISDMSVVETELEVDETSIPSRQARPGGAHPHRRLPEPDVQRRGHRGRAAARSCPPRAPPTTAIKFQVKVQIKDPPPDVKPGLSVQADILTGFRAQALVVPIQALVVRDREQKPGDAADRARRATRRAST